MAARKLHRRLMSYVKFKELAKSIKMVALSQLNNLRKKISTRGIPLSNILPFVDNIENNYKSNLLIPIGVDKSCCGPHNNNIVKKTQQLLDEFSDSNYSIGIINIGKRIKDFFKKYNNSYIIANIYNTDKEPLSLTTSVLLTEKILSKNFLSFFVIFNRYYSAFLQVTSIYELPGYTYFYKICMESKNTNHQNFFHFINQMEISTLQERLDEIYFIMFSMFLLDSLEENEYSSLGARVTAMDNSVQNATSMIDVMRLFYNKARQSSITNELIEIVSAASFVAKE